MYWQARRYQLCLIICCLFIPAGTQAWDATGHRLTAYVAWEYMSEESRENALTLLAAHPRFQSDFLDQAPAAIQAADNDSYNRWLFGQAAVWPDMARGFSGADKRRYDHPEWHWIDGTWLRDHATRHGNLYINTDPLPDIIGIPAEHIQRRAQAENIITAIDFAMHQLQNADEASEQALALSWFLHLSGDVHQPLHTGALVSAGMFPEGDRGGNAIQVNGGNLHSVWDGALRGPALENSLQMLMDIAVDLADNTTLLAYEPTRWLQESRDYLTSSVYPDAVTSNILRSENTGNQPGTITLSRAYEEEMRLIAAQRIAEAGTRIAYTLENL